MMAAGFETAVTIIITSLDRDSTREQILDALRTQVAYCEQRAAEVDG